ncbi:MAG: 2Fe-2S iron-sulfur cluster-binding protein, partial [Acidobacteria bacterium]|nr:2Fe-2S iron-sulfur cluster-binding protein [Acidobacteriota bacterium]
PTGGRIDRDRPIPFSFNGRTMRGFGGDTLASALLANGVNTVARSFKYGRPRGIVGHGVEEPNAIVDVAEGAAAIPNLRATEVELFAGLRARTSRAPWQGAVGPFARYLPTGFHYKMFLHARGFRTWERFLRATAGLGGIPAGADPDTYDRFNHHCDVLVVGAGPAGHAAALEACRAGARVVVADEQAEFGGSLLAEQARIDGRSARTWVAEAVAELESRPDALLLARSPASGLYDHNFATVVERRP